MAFFDFLKDANREKQAVRAGFRFLGDVASDLVPGNRQQRAVKKKSQEITRQVDSNPRLRRRLEADPEAAGQLTKMREAAGSKTITEGTRDLGVSVVRGIARTPETIARSTVQAASDIDNKITGSAKRDINSGEVTDPLRRALYGKERVETYQKRTEGNKKVLEESRFRNVAGPLSFLAAAGTVAADVTGGGKKEVARELEKQLAKETTEAGVRKILKGVVDDDVIERTAAAVTKTKDPNIVRNIMSRATGATDDLPPGGFPIDDLTSKKVDDFIATQPELTPGTKRLYQGTENGQPTDWYFDSPQQLKQYFSNRSEGVEFRAIDVPEGAAVSSPGRPGVFRVGDTTNPNAKLPAQKEPETTAVSRVVESLTGRPAGQGQAGIPGVNNLNRKQAELNAVTRGQRLAQAQTAGAGLSGEAATKARLAALAGKFPKVDNTALMENLRAKVSRDDFEEVLDTIRKSPNLDPNSYEPIKAEYAFMKLFNEGRIPQPAEMDILRKALGDDFVGALGETAQESLTFGKKARNFFADVLGAPKSIMSSFDISGGVRQGGVLGSRFWKEFGHAQKESIKYLKSAEAYEEGLREIASRANAPLYKKMGLAIGGNEEAFVSNVAEKIPVLGRGVAASDRAYTGGLSRLRADVADRILGELSATGVLDDMTERELKDLGRFINTASGRGNLGSLEKHAITLGEALFSPRLWKSRLDMLNPLYYKSLKGPARKYALESAASFASIAGTVLGLAALAGGTVETDARSSDFLKIRFGDTRYDILGGFQQNIVFAWREISGEKKSSTTGNVTKLGESFGDPDRLTVIGDLVSNKANPVFGAASRIIKGKDIGGNPVNPVTEIGKLAVPLNIQETVNNVQNAEGNFTSAEGVKNAVKGVLKASPGTVGVGVGTYGVKDLPLSPKQKNYIEKLKAGGRSEEEIKANELFYKTLRTGPNKEAVYDEIDKALEAGDTKKAQQLAKDYNKELSDAFNDWRSKYSKYKNNTLSKEFESKKIKLSASAIRSRIKKIKEEG